ncbi:hypothetical protein [Pseudoalteromonas phenolica]|nr:hypothetical protein [Pseudoalteromonas phenolica]
MTEIECVYLQGVNFVQTNVQYTAQFPSLNQKISTILKGSDLSARYWILKSIKLPEKQD